MISTAKRALILASFADMVSGSDTHSEVATTPVCLIFHPRIPTQGRLHCTQHTILRTALQVLTKFVRERNPILGHLPSSHENNGLHGERVVCSMPLERARCP